MKSYIARKRDGDNKEQSILDHLEGVANRAKENAAIFQSGELAYVCGRVHDIGKYSEKFQLRIRGENVTVDHSTAGGKWLYEHGKKSALAMLAAYCCMGHHGGLPNGGTTIDSNESSTLHGRLQKEIEDCSAWLSELAKVPILAPPSVLHRDSDGFSIAFFTRMLFSALVDADYIDTETFMSEAERKRGGFTGITELNERLTLHLKPFLYSQNEVSHLNALRTNLLKSCLSAAEKPNGLFTLTAPTGSGKTKSSLAFAFKHAALYGKRRVIYVAPYNTIIEQNASVFEEIFGTENVLRHYGNHYYDDESEESNSKRYSAENWDFPMITTSSVQFFQSLFASRPSICRKLHNIADSVIIFDEAQMIPVPFLIPCVRAISELAKGYGCTILLATATQAKLEKYLNSTPIEIVENPVELHNQLRRNTIKPLEKPLSDHELAELLTKSQQVLCIVNTRRHAQNLFQEVRNLCGEGVFHLSTTLYPAHRTRVLEEIRQRLRDRLPCRVISTSMIEAGVDVDFPVVYRAQAGLDSVVQAAGRCNREGFRNTDDSVVYVFTSEEHTPPTSIKPNIGAAKQIAYNHNDVASPEAMSAYFEQLFYNKGDEALDSAEIVSELNAGHKTFSFPFRKIAEEFRIIKDNTKTVYALFEAPELEARIAGGERSKELFRELADYAVSLYEHSDIKKLEEIGALTHIKDMYSNKDEILVIPKEYYDKNFGIHLSPEGGKGIML
ncbi:MAG: CRISPR-associated helicase Cas3' [Defluviitaleaceae bacterium]|nr:CRISPR-associated helicase Cas3' [Defluviitaleaceae bacterium]